MKRIELVERRDNETVVITAVYRPDDVAKKWAKEKNSKLDFFGNRCWIIK